MPQSNEFNSLCVYCAGPLFNQAERDEMTAIADTLCDAGYSVYLPHRDGMEFRPVLDEIGQRGYDRPSAGQFLHAAIFALDIYQLAVACQAVVWNLNGRTPDEGGVSEAAIAWTLGKPLVAYKDDVRSLIEGRVNPLLVGLVDFETVDRISDIPDALSAAIGRHEPTTTRREGLPWKLQRAVHDGERLWNALCDLEAAGNNRLIADVVTELFAPSCNTR